MATYPQDTATSHTTFDVVDFGTRLVDIKRPNYDHVRWRDKIPLWDRDFVHDVFTHHIDVVLELSRNRHDRSSIGNSILQEMKETIGINVPPSRVISE
jgi:hypothetical protein